MAEMMEADARIVGRLAEAVSQLEDGTRVRTDRVADGQMMMEVGLTAKDPTLVAVAVPEAEGPRRPRRRKGAWRSERRRKQLR